MKHLSNIWSFIKYLLQGFGLTLLIGAAIPLIEGFLSQGGERFSYSEAYALCILLGPVVYAIVRLLMDNAQNITAASWRSRFDSDPKAATLLQKVREYAPAQIEFLYDYPPNEAPPPVRRPPSNPMYGSRAPENTSPPPFPPQMRLKDASGRVLKSYHWPFTDINGSMAYFPWWLEHQLGPGEWQIGNLTIPGSAGNTHLGFSLGANSDGSYYKPAYYSDATPDQSYGKYMQKK